MSAHTDNERSEAAVDVPRLVRLYDWLRVEEHHGNMIACGGIFPAEEIKAGQRWQGSSGHTVTVDGVNEHSIYYSWIESGTTMTHNKEHFAFQCRYCLILPNIAGDTPEPRSGGGCVQ